GNQEQQLEEHRHRVDDVGAEERHLVAAAERHDRHDSGDHQADDAGVGKVRAPLFGTLRQVEQHQQAGDDEQDAFRRDQGEAHWVPSRATSGPTPDSTTSVKIDGQTPKTMISAVSVKSGTSSTPRASPSPMKVGRSGPKNTLRTVQSMYPALRTIPNTQI